MTLKARILVNDPPGNLEKKVLMEFERGEGYKRRVSQSETELNRDLVIAIPSASAADIVEFTTAGLKSKMGEELPVPGKTEEWERYFL